MHEQVHRLWQKLVNEKEKKAISPTTIERPWRIGFIIRRGKMCTWMPCPCSFAFEHAITCWSQQMNGDTKNTHLLKHRFPPCSPAFNPRSKTVSRSKQNVIFTRLQKKRMRVVFHVFHVFHFMESKSTAKNKKPHFTRRS